MFLMNELEMNVYCNSFFIAFANHFHSCWLMCIANKQFKLYHWSFRTYIGGNGFIRIYGDNISPTLLLVLYSNPFQTVVYLLGWWNSRDLWTPSVKERSCYDSSRIYSDHHEELSGSFHIINSLGCCGYILLAAKVAFQGYLLHIIVASIASI